MAILSIQEMLAKTESQRKNIVQVMDSEGAYDFDLANLYIKEDGERVGQEDENNIRESLRHIPLRYFLPSSKKKLAEVMSSSGTTGISGARYLIPDKIHTTIFDASVGTDLVPDISAAVVTDIPGQSLKVDIAQDGSYAARTFSSSGKLPDEEIAVTQATITPTSFGIALRITNDMVEDTPNVDLIDWHLRVAGAELGDRATTMALTVLSTATDGDGTVNTVAAYSDETRITTIASCVRMIVADEWHPDTMIAPTEALLHSVYFANLTTGNDAAYMLYANQLADAKFRALPQVYGRSQFPPIFGLTPIECQSSALHGGITSNILINCKTIVFDKAKAMVTGRKRWARIERYSDPIRDLVGAVVSARQDSVTIYNDAICVATET